MVHSVVLTEHANLLQQEISELLAKKASVIVPPLDWMRGFYSRYLVVPKRDGGMRSILDLRQLSQTSSISHAYPEAGHSQHTPTRLDCRYTLKDTFFQISLTNTHKQFLRLASRQCTSSKYNC